MRIIHKFLISFVFAAAVCMSLPSLMPTHLIRTAYAISMDGGGGQEEQSQSEISKGLNDVTTNKKNKSSDNSNKELSDAEKKAMKGDLSGLSNGASGKVQSGINKLKTTVETIAKAAGALLLAYYLIKYEMSLADDNPMSKLDATTKMGAAIALISLPSIASSMSDKISSSNTTTAAFYKTTESSLSSIALIIGGVIIVTGVFMLILSLSQENPAGYTSAVRLIAIGALLMGSSAILKALNLSQYLSTGIRTAAPGRWI